MNEPELIQLLCEHDEFAFKHLVEHYKRRVFSTILNILHDREETEDSTQDVFITVFQSISSFKKEASLSTWIYRIAVRKALDKLRRRKTRKALHQWLPWWMPQEKGRDERIFFHPGVTIENKQRLELLSRAMALLPERQRIAITLIKLQSLSYHETSKIMELSVKAIESLVSRGKENLEKILKGKNHD